MLTPEQKATLFDILSGKTQTTTADDTAAGQQQSTIQQNNQPSDQSSNQPSNTSQQGLVQGMSSPSSVPIQEGDKMHPMDAIAQIGQQLAQQNNQQSPQQDNRIPLRQNAPAPGILNHLLGRVNPGISMQANAPGLMGLLGKGQNIPVGENYAQAVSPELKKFLPSATYKMPDGSDYVSKDDLETARQAAMAQSLIQNRNANNQLYTTKDQLVAQGVPEDVANNLMAANPNGITNKEIGNYFTSERATAANTMAQSRAIMAGVAKVGQALKVGGFDSASKMASQAGSNLLLVQKAQALVDQITANGGVANIRQQAELGRNLAALVATNNGVVTDEGMNSMIPKTAMKGFAGWQEYFTNSQKPIDFTGFLPQMQDLLTREKTANIGISNAASQLGINIMGAVGQSNTGAAISKARNASSLAVGNPTQQTTTTPTAQPLLTPDVFAYAQKYKISPQQALQIKQQRAGK